MKVLIVSQDKTPKLIGVCVFFAKNGNGNILCIQWNTLLLVPTCLTWQNIAISIVLANNIDLIADEGKYHNVCLVNFNIMPVVTKRKLKF